MFLSKIFSGIFLAPVLILIAVNPSLSDGLNEVQKRISGEQGAVRAGWNGVTKVTGIDWIGKQAGLGNYQLCRKNLYVGSLFVIRDVEGEDPEDQLAVGFGIAGRIWGEKLLENGNISQKILSNVARPLATSVKFSECATFKKPGKLL